MSSLTYRPEIDGLRAIAVIAVIVYHFHIFSDTDSFLPGGFLGVDIFFVISGYLITAILIKEIVSTRPFSLMQFYERRARRILPALFAVLLVSLLTSWILLPASGLIDFTKSALSAIGISSNYFFYSSDLLYDNTANTLKPLLHTWTLGIEGQFYILFPLIILALYAFLKKHILLALLSLFSLSLLLAHTIYEANPALAFYAIHTRAWELIAGALLAYLAYGEKKAVPTRIQSEILSSLGLFLISISFFVFADTSLHPSGFTLLLIIGTCLYIWYARNSTVARAFSHPSIVWIGLISYSLYLWHYPIFSFMKSMELFPLTTVGVAISLSALIFISGISYYVIEKPFRNKERITTDTLLKSISAFCITFLIIAVYILNSHGFPQRTQITSTYNWDAQLYAEEWHAHANEVQAPKFTDDSKTNVLIVGNSHSIDTFNMFHLNSDLFLDHAFSWFHSREPNNNRGHYQIYCFEALIRTQDTSCSGREYGSDKLELFDRADIIVFSTRWKEKDISVLENILRLLVETEKRVIVLSLALQDEFKNEKNSLDQFIRTYDRMPNSKELKRLEEDLYDRKDENDETNTILKEVAAKWGVQFLDKDEYQCSDVSHRCFLLTPDGRRVLRDEDHYTLESAKFFGEVIVETGWFKI